MGRQALHPLREQVLDASQRTANPPPLRVPLITKALIGKAEHDGQKQQRQHQQVDEKEGDPHVRQISGRDGPSHTDSSYTCGAATGGP